MDTTSLPPADATRHLIPIVERASQAWRNGARDVAERLCLDVLELAPDRVGALSILYEIRRADGNSAASEALLHRIVLLEPNSFWPKNDLALMMMNKGNLAEAQVHARNAVRIAPENPQSHNLMGMVMTEAQRAPVGEFHYRRVLELTGQRDPILLANLAWNLKGQGRVDEARALYQESVASAPAVPQTLLGWARLEEADRKLEAANAKLDELALVEPDSVGLKLARAAVLGRQKLYDEALALLDSIAGEGQSLGSTELTEKGRLLDSMGRYDDAWAAFALGKQILRESGGITYMEPNARELVNRLRGFFTASRLALLPRATVRPGVPQPIFILGFPRSGTTLLEQTLTASPRIAAGDELSLVHDITEAMPRMLNSPLGYPEALCELWMGDQHEALDTLRDFYLEKVRQQGVLTPGATLFTDKMPLNETNMGLIALMFPQAPLLHMIRHPLDIMVSAMSNHFTHGFCCASALETAAQHFVLIHDLIQHYRTEMALHYLPVRYEDMVDDQENTVRAVFDFIGEPFDPAVLQFEKNARYARTASYAQVTEKLYDRSRYRYRHYLQHLGPAIEILQPVIERLGYTV